MIRLPSMEVIGGNQFELVYQYVGEDGEELNLDTFQSVSVLISEMGNPNYPVTEIPAEVKNHNEIHAVVSSEVTRELSGEYIHQPVVIFPSGAEYRFAQGRITVYPGIKRKES